MKLLIRGLFGPDPPLFLFKYSLAFLLHSLFHWNYTKPKTTVAAIQATQPLWGCGAPDDFTWYRLGPAHHGNQLSFPQFVETGQQGLWAVRQGMVMAGIDQRGLDGLQDTEQGEAGTQGRGDAKSQGLGGC